MAIVDLDLWGVKGCKYCGYAFFHTKNCPIGLGLGEGMWCRICGKFVGEGEFDNHLRLVHPNLYDEIKTAKDKRIREGLIFFTANKPKEGD
jgi:hypothetical protein